MSEGTERLTILRYPQPVLRQRAEAIESVSEDLRAVVARMIELMHEADGIGLAAPQVGLSRRVFITRGLEEGEPDRVFVNPRLVTSGPLVAHDEGCLSLPGLNVEIRRPAVAAITAEDLDGREFTLQSDEFIARVWQHEYDHLEGVLIIDRMSPLDRLATRKALKELESASAQSGS
ncbi:MAG: peptide deformylase [Planctomycetota bacterium]|jgi:peptide deformylase